MSKIVCRIRSALTAGLIASLRDSGHLREESAGERIAYSAVCDEDRIQVEQNGTIRYDGGGFLQALLTQTIQGLLPTAPSRHLLGFDEAGIGGGGHQPTVGYAMISSDIRAELIAQGVRDSKRVGSRTATDRLRRLVQRSAVEFGTAPVPEPSSESSFAEQVAHVIAGILHDLWDDGFLTKDTHIRIDQTNEAALVESCGELWEKIADRVEVGTGLEIEAEVAAASLLASTQATSGLDDSRASSTVSKPEPAEGFIIGPHRSSDKDQILSMLHDLELSYPDIQRWIQGGAGSEGVWEKVEQGAYNLLVARSGTTVAGFSLSQQKDERNAKISTFYVAPRHRSKKIGQRLIQEEIFQHAREGLRRIFVTFGHEQFETMQPFFSEFGFTADGISPQRYRDNSYEVVMGKRFSYKTIAEDEFRGFIEHALFRMEGYDVTSVGDDLFLATPKQELFHIHQLPPGRQYIVRVTTSQRPEEMVTQVNADAEQYDSIPILVALHGFPAEAELPQEPTVFDAYELERRLYPLHLHRPSQRDLILPIKPEYAERLFPRASQMTFSPQTLGLRPRNVFYRSAKGGKDVRRASRLFFYATSPLKRMVGVARLERLVEGRPSKLHGWYGGLGAWQQDRIEAHTKGDEALAYVFDWFERLDKAIPLSQLKDIIPKFNPITAFSIEHEQGDTLIHRGMDDADRLA